MQLTETLGQQAQTHSILTLRGSKKKVPVAVEKPLQPFQQNLSLEKRTSQILIQMINSPIFDKSMQEKLAFWHTRFQKEFLPNLIEFDDKVNAALALCYLLFGAIYPELNKPRPNEELDSLFSWEDGIRELLYLILPYEVDRESFIKNYGKFFEEEKTIEEKINLIQACYQKQLEALLNNASAVNNQMQATVEKLKRQLRDLNSNRKTQSEAINHRLDQLTKKVNSLAKMLEKGIEETAETGNEFERVQQQFQQIALAGQKMIDKV